MQKEHYVFVFFSWFFSPTLQEVTSFFFLYVSSLIPIFAGHSQNHLTSGFWIAWKSLIHGKLFSCTSQNLVASPLPLPHVMLESAPTILHRMPPALKGSAVILFFKIFVTGTPWFFFHVARWPQVLDYLPIPYHLPNLIYPYFSFSCMRCDLGLIEDPFIPQFQFFSWHCFSKTWGRTEICKASRHFAFVKPA